MDKIINHKIMEFKSRTVISFIFLFLVSCGSSTGGGVRHSFVEKKKHQRLRYISEVNSVRDIAVIGGNVFILEGDTIVSTSIEAGSKIRVKKLDLPTDVLRAVSMILAASEDEVWVGGGNRLFHITGNSIKEIDHVPLVMDSISVIGRAGNGRIIVGGGSCLLLLEGGRWKLFNLPFYISGGTVGKDGKIFLFGGERGVVVFSDSVLKEMFHPLSLTGRLPAGSFAPISAVVSSDGLWVLWSGKYSYVSVLSDGIWYAYTFPAGVTGIPEKLLTGAGGSVVLKAENGFFTIKPGGGSFSLVPIMGPEKAGALSYRIEPHEVYARRGRKFAQLSGYDKKPVRATPFPFKQEDGEQIKRVKRYHLEVVDFPVKSQISVFKGAGEYYFVGTETLGTFIFNGARQLVREVYLYDAKPHVPFSIVRIGDGEALFPMADGKLGWWNGKEIRKSSIGSQPGEVVYGVSAGAGDQGYAVTLIPGPDTVQVYKLQKDRMEKLYTREVDLAAGIGSIGGFASGSDGRFYFTIRSFGEKQEMGLAELRPELETLVYDGLVPVPPQYALIIPNGLSMVETSKKGKIFLGGMDGIVVINEDRSVKRYTESEGLFGDYVTDMVLDDKERLWILTVEGFGWLEEGRMFFPSGEPYRGSGVACIGFSSRRKEVVIVDEDGLKLTASGGGRWRLLCNRGEIIGSKPLDVQGDGFGNIFVITERAVSVVRE